ncbi:MAG: NAD(P)-binding protein [Gammaproteobacteria bacterium]|nr:NAD(P)-binding protein [Gammaproteobacteria bacterium]
MTKKIAILGTGMAGLGAAHRLRSESADVVMFDKHTSYGGVTTSLQLPGGFTFDHGPHVSFTKDERIQQLLADNVEGQYETIQYYVNNYWEGRWMTHPVQNNMHGLPVDLITTIVCEFAALAQQERPSPVNYEEWLRGSYGDTFTQTFPMVYTQKYHTTPAANMTTDWIGPRMYRPSLKEVVHGALTKATANIHYVTHFRYPSRGGFMSYLHKFTEGVQFQFGHQLVKLRPKERRLVFANGVETSYDGVVSSIPLPDLIPLIEGAPREVQDAAHKLACTTVVLVNIGVARADISPAHISYFYDPQIVFSRLSFPYKMSPNNMPAGTSSLQAELYFSTKYRPLTTSPEQFIEPVIRDLVRCGVLDANDKILVKQAMKLDYANIIFDLDRSPALAIVHGYLTEIGVGYCGRYGDWGYMWTDESFKSGERAAETVLKAL